MFRVQEKDRINDDFTESVGSELLASKLKNKYMNGIGKLNSGNIKSALVFGVLSAILAIGTYVIGVGDIFSIDGKALANAGVFGGINVILSLIKRLLTTDEGNFLGAVKVE